MGIADVRVDRGDGRIFSFNDADAVKFVRENPGAKFLGERVVRDVPSPAEVAATALATSAQTSSQAPATPNLERMNRDDLDALAAERGVDVSQAKTKADVIALLEAAAKSAEGA